MADSPPYAVYPVPPAEQRQALDGFQRELDSMRVRQRTRELVSRDYGELTYGPLLRANPASVQAASELLLTNAGADLCAPQLVAFGPRLFRGRFLDGMAWHDGLLDRLLRETAASSDAQWCCELGCGFGPHLARCGDRGYGGEYTAQGREVGRRLGIDVEAFDFYDLESYALIRPGSVVFTCAAVEQLPSAACLVEGLRRHKPNIAAVVQLEPTYLDQRRGSRLGHLQNTYIERSDYNRDLYPLLCAQPDIELIEVDLDVIGLNPLNPHSLFVWRFR